MARRVGKVGSIGGVVGLIASAFASRLIDQGDELLVGFSVISALGIVTYAVGELSQPPQVVYKVETLTERHHRWAKILTERAMGAARDGRCARVRRLEARVARYDPAVHDLVFMRDSEILRCLEAPAGAPPAPAATPGELPPLPPPDPPPPTDPAPPLLVPLPAPLVPPPGSSEPPRP